MKANSTKRKIFDAVDLLTEDTSSQMPVKTIRGTIGICIVRDILLKALVLSSISIDLIIRTISMEGQEHYIRQLRISKAMMSGR